VDEELMRRYLADKRDRGKRRDELLALMSDETRELVDQIELGRMMLRDHLLRAAATVFTVDYGTPLFGSDGAGGELDFNQAAVEAFDAAVLAYAQALDGGDQ
jgi:hypothetical protein